jgi:Grass antifreeze beta roll
MDHLQTRLEALEQQMHTVNRRLRWWRGLACGLAVLVGLTWALPAVIAQEEDAKGKEPKGLAQRVAALEELLKPFSREKHEIFITGANLHIVNGLGSIDCTDGEGNEIPDCPNGLGNLIVGYNEPRPDAENIRTGSHNVVVGQQHNFSRLGGLVVGDLNTISGDFAAVSGGQANTASGEFSAVSGGQSNTASGEFSVVSGGQSSTASGELSAVSGGFVNTASGRFSVVSGGNANTASGDLAVVSGGQANTASGEGSAISGGTDNTASGVNAAVSGGNANEASGLWATVSGGISNTASGEFSSVSGGQNITQDTEFGWAAGSEAEAVVEGNFRSP